MNAYQFDAEFRQKVIQIPFFNQSVAEISHDAGVSLPFVGVDEVGRGPLAGPVVAAAVILPPFPQIPCLRDSKQVPIEQREALYMEIMDTALAVGVSIIDSVKIDEINILQASLLAMRESISQIKQPFFAALIDGNQKTGGRWRDYPIVKGDQQSACIMAASLIAKVTRDQIMDDYHKIYPRFKFHQNRGYGSAEHMAVLKEVGPTPIHRRSFSPVRELVEKQRLPFR